MDSSRRMSGDMISGENDRSVQRYYPIRSGFEDFSNEVSTANKDKALNQVSDAIILNETTRKRNRKFQAEQVTFQARIDPEKLPVQVRGIPMAKITDAVRDLFENIIDKTSRPLAATDLIRLCIQADGLDKPISTTLMSVKDLTTEKVLSAVMKVLQSKDTIELDTGFYTDVITVHRPIGAGRNFRKVINIAVDRIRKQAILSIPYDSEGLCCAKAILYALAHLEKNQKKIDALRDKRRTTLMNRARDLHEEAYVPLGPCSFQEVALFEEHLNVMIVVFSSDNLNQVAYKGKNRHRRINLWLHDGHYDVIKSLPGFYATDFYCLECEKPYKRRTEHLCPNACHICRRSSCSPEHPIRCSDCDRLCSSEDCYRAHKALTGNQQLTICDQVYQCRECCQVVERRKCPKELHQCGTQKCPSCGVFVIISDHRCYLQRMEPKKPNENLVFFDFETDQSSGEHLVNFGVAQYADGSEKVFRGYTACQDFCTWLFSPQHKGFTVIAHNMKGFDGQFIMGWLLEQGKTPDAITDGSKIMSIHHTSLRIRIIDSLNFLPMPLSNLPPCFGQSELKKGYFPHLFNTRENQNYVGPLPDVRFYSPDTMTPKARKVFLEWHEEHANDVFHFQEEMEAYCRSDVDILRRCGLEYRQLFLGITGVDPFCYITLASTCMAAYRAQHIPRDTIAMVPTHGYINHTRHSPDSIRWLDFVAFTESIEIQHALNSTGECKISGISVDGFCRDTKTVYQYQGCFYHGCEQCYDPDTKHPMKGISMTAIRKKTEETTTKLRNQGFSVVEIWEHEFVKLKKEDTELQKFLKSHRVQDRLNPRDAFFGGRTNAVKLFHEGDAKYVDFTSLYPWVNKYCKYPVGHPQIITGNFQDLDNYFGFVQCTVVPPRGLYLPVLPYRSKKLLFPLCRTCADEQLQALCNHTDEERALTGTWVSEEIKLAHAKGYRITDVYEVYHFPTTSESLFKSYIDLFLKIKQESSGWPKDCVTEEQKDEYIRLYKEKEGIELEAKNIQKNPGKRQLSKLALNNLWGRFGMNTNKTKMTYVNSLADFNKLLTDPTKNIKDMYLPSEEVVALQWDLKENFVAQDCSTNIFIAAFTTAWARIKLYTEMEKLGRAVLYHDTDSIVYASNGQNDPPLGNYLGEFTDELNGDVITTFVSGGPKNYAYQTSKGDTVCKVRGFTLNSRNVQKLNFDSIKSLVCSFDTEETIVLRNPAKITRDPKRRKIVNKEEIKQYRVVYDKRVIQEDWTTLPYGY